MPSLRQLAVELRSEAKAFPGKAAQVKRKVALAAYQVLCTSTPVDTGRARSNWGVAFNSPAVGELGIESLDAVLSRGSQAIATAGAGDAIHITNNLPYITALNEGSSQQAPAGFVEAAIETARQSVRGSAAEVGL